MRLKAEITDGATALADLLPLIAESTTRMIPFANIQFKADTGEVEFQETPHVCAQLRSACCRPGRGPLA